MIHNVSAPLLYGGILCKERDCHLAALNDMMALAREQKLKELAETE